LGNKFSSFFRLGGSGPVIWSYFAEFQPKAKRGSMLSFMAAFWTLGNLFVACELQIEEFQQIKFISCVLIL
jgi:MFS family permease